REFDIHISPILLFEAPNVAMLVKRLLTIGGDNLVQRASAPVTEIVPKEVSPVLPKSAQLSPVIAPLPSPPSALSVSDVVRPSTQRSVQHSDIAVIGMAG